MTAISTIIAKGIPLKWIPLESTVIDAVKIMVGHDVGALPVLHDSRLVGVFSERDLMKRVIVQGLDPQTTKVSEVMTRELWAADICDEHTDAMRLMSERRIRHLPILDDGNLAGFISLRDLLRVELEGKEHEIRTLTDYIHYVPPSAD